MIPFSKAMPPSGGNGNSGRETLTTEAQGAQRGKGRGLQRIEAADWAIKAGKGQSVLVAHSFAAYFRQNRCLDRWVEFRLVRIDGQTAYFNGLTYHRDGDTLTIKLALRSATGSRVEEFQFTRREL